MQLNINLDKSFIDDLQKQFATPNVTEALYQLLDFYKQTKKEDVFKAELKQRVEAIDNGAEILTPYLDGMDEMLTRLKNKHANS